MRSHLDVQLLSLTVLWSRGQKPGPGQLAVTPGALLSVGSSNCCSEVRHCNSAHGQHSGGHQQGVSQLRASLHKTHGGDVFPRPIYLICFSKRKPKNGEGVMAGTTEEAGRRWRSSGVTLPAAPVRQSHWEKKARESANHRRDDRRTANVDTLCLRGSRGWDGWRGSRLTASRSTQRGFLWNGLGSDAPGGMSRLQVVTLLETRAQLAGS